MRRAAVILLLAGASACAPVDYAPEPASVVMPDSFALLDADAAKADAPEDLLPEGDAAFVALRRAAFENSPTLAAAVARIDAARAGLRGAGAERLPNISASGSVETQRISAAQFGGSGGGNAPFAVDPNRNLFQLGVNASWDPDIFGRLRASERAAAQRLDAAGSDADAVQLALFTDVARAVNDYRALSARSAAIEANLASARDRTGIIGARAKAGLEPEANRVRSEALERQLEAQLEPLDVETTATVARLATLTALPYAEVERILTGNAADASPPAPAPRLAVPSELLRARPDVRAAERRLAAANSEIAAAAAERFPRLSITGALGLIALSVGDLFTSDAMIGSLGAEVSGPLLDFGRVGAQIDQREAEAREAFQDYRATLFTAMGEVEAALGAIAARDRQVAALERQLATDNDTLSLAAERYRLGLDDFGSVIDAQRTAYATREALAAARGLARDQRIVLYRAIGGSAAGTEGEVVVAQ